MYWFEAVLCCKPALNQTKKRKQEGSLVQVVLMLGAHGTSPNGGTHPSYRAIRFVTPRSCSRACEVWTDGTGSRVKSRAAFRQHGFENEAGAQPLSGPLEFRKATSLALNIGLSKKSAIINFPNTDKHYYASKPNRVEQLRGFSEFPSN
jgi:hypothetical protein